MSRKQINYGCYYGGMREREWKALATIAEKANAFDDILLDNNRLSRYNFEKQSQEVRDLMHVTALALTILNERTGNKFRIDLVTRKRKDDTTNTTPTPPE